MNLEIRRILKSMCVAGAGITTTLGLLSGSVRAAEPPLNDPNQPYDQFSMEVVTPHVAWANPSVTGPINALVIAPCWQFRDTVELAQRLSLNVTPLMVSANTAYYGAGESMKDLDGDLDELAQLRLSDSRQYQVIVVGKVMWNVLPATVRESILKKVTQGTGLVYVSPAGEDDALKAAFASRQKADEATILEGIPVSLMPLPLPAKGSSAPPATEPFEVRLSTLGQGRIAVVDYKDLSEKTPKFESIYWATPFKMVGDAKPWYDYYYAVLARVMQWASRRELPVKVSPTVAQGVEIERSALKAGPVGFKVAVAAGFPESVVLSWRLRDEKDRKILEKDVTEKLVADKSYSIPLPLLPSGLYIIDLMVKVDGKTAGWGSAGFSVKGPGLLKEVKMSKYSHGRGEPATGEVVLTEELPKGVSLNIQVRDRLGRLVAAASPSVKGKTAGFSVSVPEPIGCIFDVTAVVSDATGPLEEKETIFGIPDLRVENFMFSNWGGASSTPQSRYATEQMRKVAGCTGYYDGVLYSSAWDAVRPVALAGARQGLKPFPYCSTWIVPLAQYEKTPDGLALKKNTPWAEQCMNNSSFLNNARKNMENYAKAYDGCDALKYSINEEGGVPLGESCFCPHCLKAFSEYAQKKYKTIDAANQVWGTAYKAWDEARGGNVEDALKTNRFERWLDMRYFTMESYNRWQLTCIDGFQSVNKNARVGPDVVVGVDRSFDIPVMTQHYGEFGHDVDYMDAVRRSFMSKDSMSEMESGNLPMEESFHRYWPWHTLLQGMTNIFWYPDYHSSGLGGIAPLFPDLRPFACYRQTGEEVKEIQQGVGPLMIQGDIALSPVAVYWSTLSYFIDIVYHPQTRWLDSLKDHYHAVADAGFVYKYVGPPQLEKGVLKDVKVLLLPYTQAMTASEAESIRTFVKNGGFLVADFPPAVFDGNGAKLPASQLADVFGDFKEMEVKTFGEGHAILIGGSLKGYTGRRGTGDAGDRRGLTRMIEQYTGTKPWCRVEDKKGLDRGDTEITLFQNGGTYLLGLLRDPGIRAEIAGAGGQWEVKQSSSAGGGMESSETVVKLPKAYHIYDVRRHDYLGSAEQFQTGLVKAQAKVFAFLPCKLTGLELALSSAKPKQGELLKMTSTIKPADAKACGLGIRLTVTGPDGKEIEDYARTLVMRDGRLETALALALDEPPGAYEVTVTEVISGLQAKAKYVVSER